MTKLQHFFATCTLDTDSNPILQRRFDETPDIAISNLSGCAITGAQRTGKSSLLFHIVKEDVDANVVFICTKQMSTPVFKPNTENTDELRRIHMRFIDSGMMLRQYLSNIHLLPTELLPTCICVDDLSIILSKNDEHGEIPYMNPTDVLHIKTWALLQNATEFLSEKLNKKTNFVVADGLTSSAFYEHYCPLVIQTQIYNETNTNPLNLPDLREDTTREPVQVYMHVAKINGDMDTNKIRVLYNVTPEEIIVKKWDYIN